jgi:hypothetical protein
VAIVCLLGAGLMLQGCDRSAAGGYREDPRLTPARVTEADRQAAAALSLTSPTSAQRGGDPYSTALGCVAAIGVLQGMIQENRLVGAREREGIQSARVEYTNRAIRLAQQGDGSQAQATAEIQRLQAAAADEPGNAARNALACITDLAEGN